MIRSAIIPGERSTTVATVPTNLVEILATDTSKVPWSIFTVPQTGAQIPMKAPWVQTVEAFDLAGSVRQDAVCARC